MPLLWLTCILSFYIKCYWFPTLSPIKHTLKFDFTPSLLAHSRPVSCTLPGNWDRDLTTQATDGGHLQGIVPCCLVGAWWAEVGIFPHSLRISVIKTSRVSRTPTFQVVPLSHGTPKGSPEYWRFSNMADSVRQLLLGVFPQIRTTNLSTN